MPPRRRTLGTLLDELAAARPDADAVVFRDQRLTYAALRARVDELARALLAVGVKKGDRVALLLPNRPEWLVAAFAVAKVGGITVGPSTFSTPREIAWTLEHAQPGVLITMEAFRGRNYLAALYELCPELARSAPGALRSDRCPELRAVVCIETLIRAEEIPRNSVRFVGAPRPLTGASGSPIRALAIVEATG